MDGVGEGERRESESESERWINGYGWMVLRWMELGMGDEDMRVDIYDMRA